MKQWSMPLSENTTKVNPEDDKQLIKQKMIKTNGQHLNTLNTTNC